MAFAAYGPLARNDPLSFREAMSRPDHKLWWEAMVNEIKATIQTKTWELVELPPEKKAIPPKWVFRIKLDAKGLFEKNKARIVVKGFSQIAGFDFNETLAPVIRIESVRILFAIARPMTFTFCTSITKMPSYMGSAMSRYMFHSLKGSCI